MLSAVEYYEIWLRIWWWSRRQGARRLFRRPNLSLFALVEKGSHDGGWTPPGSLGSHRHRTKEGPIYATAFFLMLLFGTHCKTPRSHRKCSDQTISSSAQLAAATIYNLPLGDLGLASVDQQDSLAAIFICARFLLSLFSLSLK